jgi:hypothetical protein
LKARFNIHPQALVRQEEKFVRRLRFRSAEFGLRKPKGEAKMLVDQVLRYSKNYKDEIYLLNRLKLHLKKLSA